MLKNAGFKNSIKTRNEKDKIKVTIIQKPESRQ
jgi:hypothetical protein